LFGLGTTELLIILAVVFFFFGARKIPELSQGLGRAVRNFKKGLHEPDAIDVTPKKEEEPLEKNKEIRRKP
jgi:sec-independent protein translocase protein TatA